MRSRVVLPAPLGPSKPVRPGPNEQLTWDTATFCPNHFETSVASTVASSTQAGDDVTSASDSGAGAGTRRLSATTAITANDTQGSKPARSGIQVSDEVSKIQSVT